MIEAEQMIRWVRALEAYRRVEGFRGGARTAAQGFVEATIALTEQVSLGKAVEAAIGTYSTLAALEDETTDPELGNFLRDAKERAARVAADVIVKTVSRERPVAMPAPPVLDETVSTAADASLETPPGMAAVKEGDRIVGYTTPKSGGNAEADHEIAY